MTSCAFFSKKGTRSSRVNTTTSTEPPSNTSILKGKSLGVWHLISPEKLSLVLSHFDTKITRNILLEKGTNKGTLKSGDWQVRGIKYGPSKFRPINDSQKIVFKLKEKKPMYLGSIIFECPKVNDSFFEDMKKMKYFNRFFFKSKKKICELVLGNDFENVKNELYKTQNELSNSLILGF